MRKGKTGAGKKREALSCSTLHQDVLRVSNVSLKSLAQLKSLKINFRTCSKLLIGEGGFPCYEMPFTGSRVSIKLTSNNLFVLQKQLVSPCWVLLPLTLQILILSTCSLCGWHKNPGTPLSSAKSGSWDPSALGFVMNCPWRKGNKDSEHLCLASSNP